MVETHPGKGQISPRYWGFVKTSPQAGGCGHGNVYFDARPRGRLRHPLRGGWIAIGQGQESQSRHTGTGSRQPNRFCLPAPPCQGRPILTTTNAQNRSSPARCTGDKDQSPPGRVRTLVSDAGYARRHLSEPIAVTTTIPYPDDKPEGIAHTGRLGSHRCTVRCTKANADASVRPIETIGYHGSPPIASTGLPASDATTERLRTRTNQGVQIQGVRP